MAHEKERELLEKFQDYWNLYCDSYGAIYQSNIEKFLSTLPEEKEETNCKLKQEIRTCKIWQDRKSGCWGCVNYIEFNPSK